PERIEVLADPGSHAPRLLGEVVEVGDRERGGAALTAVTQTGPETVAVVADSLDRGLDGCQVPDDRPEQRGASSDLHLDLDVVVDRVDRSVDRRGATDDVRDAVDPSLDPHVAFGAPLAPADSTLLAGGAP